VAIFLCKGIKKVEKGVILPVRVAGVAGGDAGVAPRAPALERVSSVDDALAGDAEVAQFVVFLLVAGVGHRGHPRPLLR